MLARNFLPLALSLLLALPAGAATYYGGVRPNYSVAAGNAPMSVSVASDGVTITINWPVSMSEGAGWSGSNLNVDGTDAGDNISPAWSGDGTATWTGTLTGATILQGATPDLDFDGTANSIEATSGGADLGTMLNFPIRNDSTQVQLPELVGEGAAVYAASGDVVVPLPTHAEGDLLVIFWGTRTGSTGTAAADGYDQEFTFTSASAIRITVEWKIAGAMEADPTFVSASANTTWAQAAAFRYVNATTPFNTFGTGVYTGSTSTSYGVAGDVTCPDNGAVIVLGAAQNDATGAPGLLTGDSLTWEAIGDGNTTLGGDGSFAWQFGTKAGAITLTDKEITRAMSSAAVATVMCSLNPQ